MPVLVVVLDETHGWRDAVNATESARPGTHVRLVVGSVRPPRWGLELLRADLVIQVEASDVAVLDAWTRAFAEVNR